MINVAIKEEEVLKWIYDIDELLSYAYDAYQKLEAIERRYGLKKLINILDVRNSEFQLYDNLQYIYFSCINHLVFGICNVYDVDSKATSFKSVLNAMLYDLKMKDSVSFDIEKELNEIKNLTDKETMDSTYCQLRTLRDKSIAHSDKAFKGEVINLKEVKVLLDATTKRANKIFGAFGEHVCLFDFKAQCIKNPVDDLCDKYGI